MSPATRQTIIRYAIAFALALAIVLFKLLIGTFIPGQQAFLLFFAAVTLTTWYGGIGPGLLSAVLSALFANIFFFEPSGEFSSTPATLFQIMLFFLESLFVVGLASALRDRRSAVPKPQLAHPQVAQQNDALALLENFQVYAPIGLAFFDKDLRYVRINYAMAEANALPPAAHLGRLLKDINPGLTPETLTEISQVLVTGKPLLDQPLTLTKPTMLGVKQQHFLTSYYRIRGADGQALGIGAVMMDITQRRADEEAIRESETRFRTLADTAPVMIWLAGVDRKRTYFNKGWLDFTGRTMEEELGNGWQENVHPDDIENFRQAYYASFENPQPYKREYRLRRYDGEYRWILATGVPRYTSDGSFNGFIGTCIDIHERKQSEMGEQFLTQSGIILASSLDYESTLANVIQLAVPNIADWCAVDMLTADGGVERLAVAHIDPEKVKWAYEIQKHFPVDMNATSGVPNVLRTGQTEFYPEITEEMIEGAATDAESYEILRDIGFTSLIITPLVARGRTLGVLTFAATESRRHYTETDVKLAEQLAVRAALAVDNARLFRETLEERERFQVTLTSVGDAVIATDVQRKITFINQVAEQLTGWNSSEALGKPLTDILKIVHESSRESIANLAEKVLREGRTISPEDQTMLLSRDGREIPIDNSGAPIPGPNGSISGVVLVFHDISERRRAEQRQQFLANATNLLISSIDYTTTLQHITQLAVPVIADSAVVYLLDENGTARQAAMYHVDPELFRQRLEMSEKYTSFSSNLSSGFQKVIRSGEPELLTEVSDEILQAAANNEDHLQMLRGLNYQSSLSVPLKNTGGILGAFSLYTTKGGRTLNLNDMALAEELGRVISLALENARLYRSARHNGSMPDENSD